MCVITSLRVCVVAQVAIPSASYLTRRISPLVVLLTKLRFVFVRVHRRPTHASLRARLNVRILLFSQRIRTSSLVRFPSAHPTQTGHQKKTNLLLTSLSIVITRHRKRNSKNNDKLPSNLLKCTRDVLINHLYIYTHTKAINIYLRGLSFTVMFTRGLENEILVILLYSLLEIYANQITTVFFFIELPPFFGTSQFSIPILIIVRDIYDCKNSLYQRNRRFSITKILWTEYSNF